VVTRILEALVRLAETGQGDVTRLQGVADEWRLRVGDWRVRFRDDHPTRTLEVLRILPQHRCSHPPLMTPPLFPLRTLTTVSCTP
jgi:mRNA-degrading endonuclease RelE of RelBE toxin-antitoxin system